MKAGKELIIATKPFAAEDPATSWKLFLSAILFLGLALAGAIAEIPLTVRIACSVLAGLLTVRLFVIYHDFEHHAILQKSKFAKGLMTLAGLWCLAAASVWKSSHDYHHAHNSKLRSAHIGSFPIMTREAYERAELGGRFRYLFVRHPLTILFGYVTIFLIGMCLLPFWRNPKRHLDCLFAFVLHFAVGAALYSAEGGSGLLLFLVVPHFLASAAGSYLFYAQHNFPEAEHSSAAGWSYESAALRSSSFMEMPAWLHWFTANIGYHHIHHLNSRIPFYRLPEVMREMPEVQSPRRTSLNPLEIIRCLRLKFWDAGRGRMTGWE